VASPTAKSTKWRGNAGQSTTLSSIFRFFLLFLLFYQLALKMAHTHRNPPFRAEHLGSLLRPKDFLEKRNAFEKKEISQAEMTKYEDEAIKKVVDVQLENNYRAISDGEYRSVV